ncbi:cilia- and flagella-associated protein 36-like [Lethenteron reissneri]|uniref:cilia- and flagella-associated protein 36-like n=1 Tax=Lethenteron reissneri TaxID=7753 RepID=UPI002AB74466|nr:cilia- and flagella-associated protein 36-like [Lethenteron reissneri]
MVDWVLDSVVGFLRSPRWDEPIRRFMELECSVFQPGEENPLCLSDIHGQYRDVVGDLLDEYCEEVGISEEAFLEACNRALSHGDLSQSAFKPVWAAEDFVAFKELMVEKNLEMQGRALNDIVQHQGVLPDCLLEGGEDAVSMLERREAESLHEALRLSKEEYEQELLRRRLGSIAAEEKPRATTEGPALLPDVPGSTAGPRQGTVDAALVEGATTKNGGKSEDFVAAQAAATANLGDKIQGNGCSIGPERKALRPLRSYPRSTQLDVVASVGDGPPDGGHSQQQLSNEDTSNSRVVTSQSKNEDTDQSTLCEEEIAKRRMYLEQQRDRLRSAQRSEETGRSLDEETGSASGTQAEFQELPEEEKKALQRRRLLAETLKREVLHKD